MKTAFTIFFALVVSFSAYAQGSYTATGAVKNQIKEYGAFVNSASGTLAVGEVVCLDITADDGIAIDYCTTSGDPAIGVVVAACAVGASCKVQTAGMFEAAVFGAAQGNAVAGGAAFAHTNGKAYGDTTDDGKEPFGVFLDAASATGTVQVFIRP